MEGSHRGRQQRALALAVLVRGVLPELVVLRGVRGGVGKGVVRGKGCGRGVVGLGVTGAWGRVDHALTLP